MTPGKKKALLWTTYRILYNNTNPKANFDTLVEEAEVNEGGVKHIPSHNYEIDKMTFDSIMESQIKKFHLTDLEQLQFKFSIDGGCRPTILVEEETKIDERVSIIKRKLKDGTTENTEAKQESEIPEIESQSSGGTTIP